MQLRLWSKWTCCIAAVIGVLSCAAALFTVRIPPFRGAMVIIVQSYSEPYAVSQVRLPPGDPLYCAIAERYEGFWFAVPTLTFYHADAYIYSEDRSVSVEYLGDGSLLLSVPILCKSNWSAIAAGEDTDKEILQAIYSVQHDSRR